MMSEFAAEWTEEKVSQFDRYDPNGDGVITLRECLAAIQQERPAAEKQRPEP
jgi:hypothetical protein